MWCRTAGALEQAGTTGDTDPRANTFIRKPHWYDPFNRNRFSREDEPILALPVLGQQVFFNFYGIGKRRSLTAEKVACAERL